MRPGGQVLGRRIGWAGAIAAGALAVAPLAAAARPEHGGSRAAIAASGGTVYGGVTAQGYPVVIEVSRSGRKIVRSNVGIRLPCTSGGVYTYSDSYTGGSVSRKRRFGGSFGPTTERNDDGTTTDFEGSISGAFNRSRTKVSGKWSLEATERDAAGAVVDTCDSGSVRWSAKQ